MDDEPLVQVQIANNARHLCRYCLELHNLRGPVPLLPDPINWRRQ